MIVAIDGPAGSGKSTVARILAARLKFRYIETGSMYRAVAWKAQQQGIQPEDRDQVAAVAQAIVIEFQPGTDHQQVWVDGQEVTAQLKSETIGSLAASAAAIPEVRKVLTEKQRAMGREGNAVMDGRDIGTVVFPQAEKKFFMVADPVERARRRYDEMKATQPDLDLEQVIGQVKQRDYEDENRAVSPLKPAEDSIILDTTQLQIEEVVERMMRAIQPVSNI